jgi:hypothetical protein
VIIDDAKDLYITNITEVCNIINKQYYVSFLLFGGSPTTYTVIDNYTGLPVGMFASVCFTSCWHNSGTPYSFTAFDATNPPILNEGFVDCGCSTYSGTMPHGLLSICGANAVQVCGNFVHFAVK